MDLLEVTISDIAASFKEITQQAAPEFSFPDDEGNPQIPSLGFLVNAFDNLLKVLGDRRRRPKAERVSELGDHGLEILEQILLRAEHNRDFALKQSIEALLVSFAVWVRNQNGQLARLQSLAGTIAEFANATRDQQSLKKLYQVTHLIIAGVSDAVRHDYQNTDPNRPWRLLVLNHAIIATRTHDPERIEEAYELLCRLLPEDAADFFSEGMAQMDLIGYPDQVRAIVSKYHRQCQNPHLH
jgi:hypothetical protein